MLGGAQLAAVGDEVGVDGREAVVAQAGGYLGAVVAGVHHGVGENVVHQAVVAVAHRVGVGNNALQLGLVGLNHALVQGLGGLLVQAVAGGQVVFLPHFHGAGRGGEARQPNGLGVENVAEQAQHNGGQRLAGSGNFVEAIEHGGVGPHVESTKFFEGIHGVQL